MLCRCGHYATGWGFTLRGDCDFQLHKLGMHPLAQPCKAVRAGLSTVGAASTALQPSMRSAGRACAGPHAHTLQRICARQKHGRAGYSGLQGGIDSVGDPLPRNATDRQVD